MRWIKSCWREVITECILNCFRHTGLVPGRTTSRRALKKEEELVKVLAQRVAALRVRDPMDIEDFVCNATERETEMEVASSDDLLSDSVSLALLASVQEDPEEVCEYDSEEAEEYGHSDTLLPKMSLTDKADVVRPVIFLLAEHPDVEASVLSSLRVLQSRVRDDLQEERDSAQKQTSIKAFLRKMTE
ncbi:hypothetical protein GN244_ATG01865 [Phytophthora infestans]|uniref:Uncharacterized protein n=1 Tax=Phytophthora infestans TaxID=4787 RepID=A0A833W7L6_PHYIN|nr:hypothetical protein GN244_ATG01865 [Phytophthora infestans]KAF4137003.1 hypothetical protein GN958_ATG13809 [Phytophthora infestans]